MALGKAQLQELREPNTSLSAVLHGSQRLRICRPERSEPSAERSRGTWCCWDTTESAKGGDEHDSVAPTGLRNSPKLETVSLTPSAPVAIRQFPATPLRAYRAPDSAPPTCTNTPHSRHRLPSGANTHAPTTLPHLHPAAPIHGPSPTRPWHPTTAPPAPSPARLVAAPRGVTPEIVRWLSKAPHREANPEVNTEHPRSKTRDLTPGT